MADTYLGQLSPTNNGFDFNGTHYKAGDSFGPFNACQALGFINASSAANPGKGHTEEHQKVIAKMGSQCTATGNSATPQPDAGSAPVEANPATTGGDSANNQGAPQPEIAGNVGINSDDGTNPNPSPSDEPTQPPNGEPDLANGGEQPQIKTNAGDPVDIFTGAFYLQETDLEIPHTLFPISFIRTYRSGAASYGPFGWNWDHNYNIYIRELADGNIALWRNLHEDIFKFNGANFEPPNGIFEKLKPVAGLPQVYELTSEGGAVLRFERPAGWLTAERIPINIIHDRHGNALTFTYGAEDKLAEIRDDDDRFLHFDYDFCGLLIKMQDNAGRTYMYEHDEQTMQLTNVISPPTTDHPEGIIKTYHYEQPFAMPELRHNITRVEDSDGNIYLENKYDQDPASRSYARVTEQLYGSFLYQFNYTPLQWVPENAIYMNIPALRVEVMNPDFGLETYTFNYRGDLLDRRFRLNKDNSFRVVVMQYEFDTQGNLTVFTKPDGSQEINTYDFGNPDPCMRGKLLKKEITSASGFPSPSRIIWKGQYEPLYQLLIEEKNETNAVTKYQYDFDITPAALNNTGKLVKVIAPDTKLPDGTTQTNITQFENNDLGQVKAIIQPDGVRQEMSFGGAGNIRNRLIKNIFDKGGLNISINTDYNAFGFDTDTIDGNGNTTKKVINALGLLEKIILPAIGGSNAENVFHYNSDKKVNAFERPKGTFTDPLITGTSIIDKIDRNVLGYPTKCYLSSNTGEQKVISIDCDFRGLPEEIINPDESRVKRTYDERGLFIKEEIKGKDGIILTSKKVYDRSGNLIEEVNANGLTTKYEYEAFGRVFKVTLPNNTEINYKWLKGNLLESEEVTGDDGSGTKRSLSKKSYGYDERYRKISETIRVFSDNTVTGVDMVTAFYYNKLDKIEKIVDSRGGVRIYKYDGLRRLITEIDPMGNEQHYTYDNNGNNIKTESHHKEPDGTVSIIIRGFTYDQRNRQTENIEPDGAKLINEYDDRNLVVRQIDYLGLVKEIKYNALGNRFSEIYDSGGLAITHQWILDNMSRAVAYIDPMGQTSNYTFDGVGRNNKITYPNGFSSLKTFNNNGQVIKEELGSGVTFEYTYDAANRLTTLNNTVVPAAVAQLQQHVFTYDGLNRVITAKTGTNEVIRHYDSNSRLTLETTLGQTIICKYDDLTGHAEKVLPDGRTERNTYNLNGILTKIEETVNGTLGSGGATIASFIPSGDAYLGETACQGNLKIRNKYDERKRLVELSMSSVAGINEKVKYRYDKGNRKRVEAIAGQNSANKYFEFDNKYRLSNTKDNFNAAVPDAVTQTEHDAAVNSVKAASSAATHIEAFSYNAADDRVQYKDTGSADKNYTYVTGHKIQNDGINNYAYFKDGTLQSDGALTYNTDAFGRIIAINSGANVLCTIKYDAFNRPSLIQEAGKPDRSFNYLGAFASQENENGTASRQITQHPVTGVPVAYHTINKTHYTLFDGRYNLIGLANTNGDLLETYRYNSFGKSTIFNSAGAIIPSSAHAVEPIFGGQHYLSSAGLYYSKRRLMNPVNGAFLSSDPRGYSNSASLYVYAAQNPVDLVDPDGEIAFLAILAVVAIGAVVAGALNLARQEIQLAEGSRKEFSWGELGISTGLGAVVAPILVFAPELAIPLAAYGTLGGIEQISQGNYATGTFDIVTSLAPFGIKGVRNTRLGNGPIESVDTRLGRFTQIQENLLTPVEKNPTRVTHLTTEENIKAIENGDPAKGIPPGRLLTKQAPFIEGSKEGAWVAPTTAKQLGAWRRLMTGLPNSENYVEFDVEPGELATPGGIKRPFSAYQRQIPSATGANEVPEGYIDLTGRNPKYGVLKDPPTWPLFLSPTYKDPKKAQASPYFNINPKK